MTNPPAMVSTYEKGGNMRTFRLVRDEDPTGISGTGVVAEGVEFYDGTVVMRWRGPIEHPWGTTEATTVVHPDITNVDHLHGHNGATHIEWDDTSMSEQQHDEHEHEPEDEKDVDREFNGDIEFDPDDSDDPGEGGNDGTDGSEEDES